MRNLFYSLVFVLVLLLAGSVAVRGGEIPGGGGTVPVHQVWLPVVGRHNIPRCQIAEMGYSYETVKPKPDLPEKHLHVFWVRNSDPFYPSDNISATARIYGDTGEQLGEAVMYPGQTIPPPHNYLSVKFDDQFLESGKNYSWQARIDCRGETGSWINPQNITAGQ